MATTDSGSVDTGAAEAGVVSATGTLVRPDPRRRSLPPLATGTYELPEPGEGSSGPRRLLGYAVPTLVVAALAGRWFAGDDTPPLVLDNLRPELWSAWSHQLSGAGSTSYPMARALDAGVAALGEALGLTGSATSALLTTLCAAYAAVATVWLARSLVRPTAAAFAGLLAVINPVVLLTLPSRTPLVAIGVVSSIAVLLHGAVRTHAEPALEGGSLLPLSGAGSCRGRPTPLAVALVALPLSALATEPLLLVGLALVMPVAAVAFAVVEGRASVRRLLRFLAWAVPVGLVASLWWLVPAVLTWSVWREGIALRLAGLPTSHLAAIVVPGLAVAAAAVVDRRLDRSDVLRRTGYRRWRVLWVDALTALGAVAVLAVPLPLWTGAVGDGASSGLDDGWHEVAAAVDAPGAVTGKVLVLPLTSGGAEDDLPRQLLRRPVLQRPADPLFRLPGAVDAELRRAERLAASGDARRLAAVLDELGVSHLVVRDDAASATTAATVNRLRGWRPAGRFGVADVVERVRPAPLLDAVAAEADGNPPELAWARHDAGHYEVDVDTAPGGGPFVLRLAETYGSGWTVQGLPATWSARHGLIAGYANGWQIEGEGTATLHLRHQPSQWSAYAAYLSLAAVAIAALASLVPVLRRVDDPPDGGRTP
jgi:hypothetical protein